MTKPLRGRLICFEGLDGAGKTTVAQLVTSVLNTRGIHTKLVERKDPNFPLEDLSKHMLLLKKLIWEYGDIPVQKLGDYYALYNMASWFSAIDIYKIRPLLDAGVTTVVDNWYFKFLSRLIRKKTIAVEHLKGCFSHLTYPDLVIYLDITPEVAAKRKDHFNKGETGYFDGFGQPSREHFIRYQKLVQEIMNKLAQQHGWFTVSVDNKTPQQVGSIIIETIEQICDTPRVPINKKNSEI